MKKQSLRNRTYFTTAIIGCSLVLSAALGAWAHVLYTQAASADNSWLPNVAVDVRQSAAHGNSLTNPLLECREFPEHILIGQRFELQNQVIQLIDDHKRHGDVTDAAVYFRELVGGPWFEIREERKFTPASLLKLPLAISFYWQAEAEPSVLEQKIEYEKGNENYENQPYGPSRALENMRVYSVQELIELMLRESSNEAALVLTQMAGEEQLRSVYSDFGFEPPTMGQDYVIDVHTFGSFFRILFNATYLDRFASERILKILTESTFREGLVAGVPSDVVVAHKFGSRAIEGQEGSKQLHDCGIIYAESPYILCVMTQGNDFPKLAAFIKETSALVYKVAGRLTSQ